MCLAINVALANKRFLLVRVAFMRRVLPFGALKAYNYPLTRSHGSYPRAMPSRFSVIFVFVDASAAARDWISANGNPVGKARGITRGSDVVFTTGTRCDAPRHLLRVCSLVWSLNALHLTLICLASARRVCSISSRLRPRESRHPGPEISRLVCDSVCLRRCEESASLANEDEKSGEINFDYYPIVPASRSSSLSFDK